MSEILNQEEMNEVQEGIAEETAEELAEAPVEVKETPDNKLNIEEGNQSYAILEGLLFVVGDEGLTLQQAQEVLDVSEKRVLGIFDELQRRYLDDEHGIEIVNYGGVYKFLSKAVVHPYAERLFQNSKKVGLSQSALETLAIIAYKQPITRVEIEEIRGVGCDMMLRKLMARNLIQEDGRSDAPGRPILYSVTTEFMDSFKLFSLDELPDLPDYAQNEEETNLFD